MKRIIVAFFALFSILIAWCILEDESTDTEYQVDEDMTFDEVYSNMVKGAFSDMNELVWLIKEWEYIKEYFEMEVDIMSDFVEWKITLNTESKSNNNVDLFDLKSDINIGFDIVWSIQDWMHEAEIDVSWVIDMLVENWKYFASLQEFDIESDDPEVQMIWAFSQWLIDNWLLISDMEELEGQLDSVEWFSMSTSDVYWVVDEFTDLLEKYPFLKEEWAAEDWGFVVWIDDANIKDFFEELLEIEFFQHVIGMQGYQMHDNWQELSEIIDMSWISEVLDEIDFQWVLKVEDNTATLKIQNLIIADEVDISWQLSSDSWELLLQSLDESDTEYVEISYQQDDSSCEVEVTVYEEEWVNLFDLTWTFDYVIDDDSYSVDWQFDINVEWFDLSITFDWKTESFEDFEIQLPQDYMTIEEILGGLMWWMFGWSWMQDQSDFQMEPEWFDLEDFEDEF